DVVLAAVVDDQALEGLDDDVRVGGGALDQHLAPLVDREQARLRLVDEDGDDDLVVQRGAPADDVEVAVGDRIEGAGAQGASDALAAHRARPYQSTASP